MLSTNHRFHGHGSLRYVYHRGKKVRGGALGVSYIKNSRRVHSRFAVVVSKKVFKQAVLRNHLRRRIYEIIRLNLDSISKPYDIVLTIYDAKLLQLDYQSLQKEVLQLLAKERLI